MSDDNYSGSHNLEVMIDAVNYNQFLKDCVAEQAVNPDRVLDFGAGLGTFSGSVSVAPGQISCVEPDVSAQEILSAKGYRVYGSAEELPREQFTYVFSLNVLEHIEDDQAAIEQLYRAMAPGSRIFIYVPAFNHLRTKMDDLVGHCRRYKRKELSRLISAAGFTVLDSGYTDILGYFATWLVILMEKFQKNPSGELNRPLVIVYDRVAFPLSRILSSLFKYLVGKNAYVVATKP
jgi:SAM-dependent methyltransferase